MTEPGKPDFAAGCVIVTGASSGIGRAAAVEIAGSGKDVALFDVDRDAAESTAKLCTDLGVRAEVYGLDVGDNETVRDAVDRAASALGGIGAVLPCAGIVLFDKAEAIDPNAFTKQMRVNVEGVINVVNAAIPHLKAAGDGAAVAVVSSMEGLNGQPVVASYTISKHAVTGFVRTAALSLAPQGIRINAVCPGPVDTPMLGKGDTSGDEVKAGHAALIASLPMRRIAQPEEIATVLKFLISSDASYVNGAALVVDGGRSIQ